MNKLRLPVFLLSAFFLIQSCKKDTVSASAYTNAPFQANINGTTWAPDTISTTIDYDLDTKSKTFYCSGIKDQKEVIFSVALLNASDSPGFSTGTFNVDSVTVFAQYKTLQQNQSGQYVYLPHGSVSPGSGTIIIPAVDSVAKKITGTFSFYSRSVTYDNSGQVQSISVDNITAGEFKNIPYTFNDVQQ
ncbi:MAG TPA: DUF6252 family protein [Mucilaginibacter sp.]|nr:DUF6252 family protein [Mucilaginibacter sp.]